MSNISAKRGFLWPSFEIYSGVSGFTDYGPLGASLKNNIMQKWRKQYVSGEGFYEIEGPTVMPKEVLKASGHVDNFTDPMCKSAARFSERTISLKRLSERMWKALKTRSLTKSLLTTTSYVLNVAANCQTSGTTI